MKTLTFTVDNTGNAALTISSISRAGEDSSEFTVDPASTFTVAPGAAAQTVTVTFAPTSEGSKTASLSFIHNAAGSPTDVSLTGNGTIAAPPPAPVISLAVSSLGFDDVEVGGTSLEELFITNTGTASLSITGISLSDIDATEFRFSPETLDITSGTSQSLIIVFAPTSAGGKLASLDLIHNAAGSPTSLPLTGTGQEPKVASLSFTPSPLSFGDVRVNDQEDLTLTLSNGGGAGTEVSSLSVTGEVFTSLTLAPFTVEAGQIVSVLVRFEPTVRKSYIETLIAHSDDDTVQVLLLGSGVAPQMVLTPSDSLKFGLVDTGRSEVRPLIVSNVGDDTLQVSGIGSSNQRFTASPVLFAIPPGGAAQEVAVTFIPLAEQLESGTLTISSNDLDQPAAEIGLSGEGVIPPPEDSVKVLSLNLVFGEVPLDSTRIDTVRLVNPTAQTVSGEALIIGTGFSLPTTPAFPFSVPTQDTVKIPVTFDAITSGDFSALLRIRIPGRDIEVFLSGIGASPSELEVSPTSIDFVQVEIGGKGIENLQVKNVGSGILQIFSIRPSWLEFRVAQRDSLPISLAPGESRFLDVVFAPREERFIRGDLVLFSDAVINPEETVRLQGEGVLIDILPPRLEVNPSEIVFGQLSPGDRDTSVLTLSNEKGVGILFVDAISSADPQVHVLRDSLVLDRGERINVLVTVEAISGGSTSDSLRILSNDPEHPVLTVPWRYQVPPEGLLDQTIIPDEIHFTPKFGRHRVEVSLPVRNLGRGPLTVELFSSDNQVTFKPDSLDVAPDAFATVRVRFLAAAGGMRTGTFQVLTNDPGARTVDIPWVAPTSLEVVSVQPSNGEVEIDEDTDIRIVFNEALLQVGRFIAIEAELIPSAESGDLLNNLRLSNRGRTAIFEVELKADTVYRLIVTSATGVSGAELERVFASQFTTGLADVVVGTIAGRVSTTGGQAFDGSVFVFAEDGSFVAQDLVDEDGSYKISGLTEGSYRIFVDGLVDGIGVGGGRYDADEDGQADLFVLTAGEERVGIDILVTETVIPDVSTAAGASLDLDGSPGNQRLGSLQGVQDNQEVSLAVYADNVTDLFGFSATIHFDTTQVVFLGSEAASGEGENLLRTSGGTAVFLRPFAEPGVVAFTGVVLAPTPETAPDGSGLIAVFHFAADSPFEGVADFELTQVVYSALAGGDTLEVVATALITSSGVAPGEIDKEEVPGPVSLDLNAADGDQNQKSQGGLKPGDSVNVQLFVEGAPEVSGYNVSVQFDPGALEPGFFVAGSFVQGLTALTNISDGVVEFGGASLFGTTGEGEGYLGVIPFDVLEGFSNETYIAVIQVRFNSVTGDKIDFQQNVLGQLTGSAGSDFNGDGVVDFDDFFLFAAAFGSKSSEPGFDSMFDLDSSGEIDFDDFFIFAGNFGQ